MKRIYLLLLGVIVTAVLANTSYAQVGFGTKSPHPSAAVDIKSEKMGLLIPHVSLVDTANKAPILADPADGLLVYNISTVAAQKITPGFYYWKMGVAPNGTWKRLESTTTADIKIISDSVVYRIKDSITNTNNTLGDSIFVSVKNRADSVTKESFIELYKGGTAVSGVDSAVLVAFKIGVNSKILRDSVTKILADSIKSSTIVDSIRTVFFDSILTTQEYRDTTINTIIDSITHKSTLLDSLIKVINNTVVDSIIVKSEFRDSIIALINKTMIDSVRVESQFLDTLLSKINEKIVDTVRLAPKALGANIVVVNDANFTVVDTNYTIIMTNMTTDRTVTLPDPTSCRGRMLVINQLNTENAGLPITVKFSTPVRYSSTRTALEILSNTTSDLGTYKVVLHSDGIQWYVISTML